MTPPPYGWAASDRSLTLLRAFLLASAAILVVGAVVPGGALSGALRGQAIADERDSSNQFAQAVLDQFFDVGTGRVARIQRDPSNAVAGGYSRDGTTFLNDQALQFLKRQLGERFVSVKVWGTNGVIAWESLDPSQIGKRFPRGAALMEALRDRHAVAHIAAPSGPDHVPELRRGFEQLHEVYSPLIDSSGRV